MVDVPFFVAAPEIVGRHERSSIFLSNIYPLHDVTNDVIKM